MAPARPATSPPPGRDGFDRRGRQRFACLPLSSGLPPRLQRRVGCKYDVEFESQPSRADARALNALTSGAGRALLRPVLRPPTGHLADPAPDQRHQGVGSRGTRTTTAIGPTEVWFCIRRDRVRAAPSDRSLEVSITSTREPRELIPSFALRRDVVLRCLVPGCRPQLAARGDRAPSPLPWSPWQQG